MTGVTEARHRMTAPILSASPLASLTELIDMALDKNVSGIPIMRSLDLVGMVSTSDLVCAIVRPEVVAGTQPCAQDIMQGPVITTGASTPITDVARVLAREMVHRLVVVDHAHAVGVISPFDLLHEVKQRRIDTPLSALMVRAIAGIDLGTPLDEATGQLARAHVHGLVVQDGDRPVGLFTHREALSAFRQAALPRAVPVEELMSYAVIRLEEDTPVHRAAAYALAMDVRRILVMSGDRVAGIVSALDLISTLAPMA
jgi:predicted transcriptional regulator